MSRTKTKASPTDRLEAELRTLIEPERTKLVALVLAHYKGSINRFLEKRNPNKTFFDVFQQYNENLLTGLVEATNYREAESKMREEWRRNGPQFRTHVKPDFDVEYLPDATEILQGLAEKAVEEMIANFLARAMFKLGPVVDRKPDFRVGKPEASATGAEHYIGRFEGNAWTGYLQFSWKDNVKFTAKLKIITNFSGKGTEYAQYPMTFHHCCLDPTAEREGRGGMLKGIEGIWASVGYVPPKPEPTNRRKWGKLVSGSVIEVDGKPVLIHTPGQIKKQNLPADAPQIARIEVGSLSASLQRYDGTDTRYRFTDEERAEYERIERDYTVKDSWGVAKKMRRERAFANFFLEGNDVRSDDAVR